MIGKNNRQSKVRKSTSTYLRRSHSQGFGYQDLFPFSLAVQIRLWLIGFRLLQSCVATCPRSRLIAFWSLERLRTLVEALHDSPVIHSIRRAPQSEPYYVLYYCISDSIRTAPHMPHAQDSKRVKFKVLDFAFWKCLGHEIQVPQLSPCVIINFHINQKPKPNISTYPRYRRQST